METALYRKKDRNKVFKYKKLRIPKDRSERRDKKSDVGDQGERRGSSRVRTCVPTPGSLRVA